MNDKKNQYLLVGSFVVAGFALIIIIWLWFSATSRQTFDTYKVVFHEPVDGVTTNSVVKYNGVEVGKVKLIELDSKDPSQIYVYINVRQGIPIATTTYASLKPQGVTGMSFINLNLEHQSHYDLITPHNNSPYPIIASKPSFLYSLTEQAQSLALNVNDISEQFKKLLNDKNIQALSETFHNIAAVSQEFSDHKAEIGKALVGVDKVLDNANKNAEHLNEVILKLGSLSMALEKNSVSLDKVLNNVQDNTLRNINTIVLPSFNQALMNLNNVSLELHQFLISINQNPSILVRGRNISAKGPGE